MISIENNNTECADHFAVHFYSTFWYILQCADHFLKKKLPVSLEGSADRNVCWIFIRPLRATQSSSLPACPHDSLCSPTDPQALY